MLNGLLGHQYTAKRGQRWLLIVVCLGAVMIVGMFLMLAGVVPPLLWLLTFVVFAVACVAACLDFAIPILKEKK